MGTVQRVGLILLLVGTSLFQAALRVNAQASKNAATPTGLQAIEVSEPGGQILSFRHLSGSTVVAMRGTRYEPQASTHLKVGSRPGFTELDINRGQIKGLQPARRFGRDFHTYVLWAVSVDGAAVNLGEVTFDPMGPVSINVTTPYQTFWLMVTAEPDFAVSQPSPVVVMYSVNQDEVVTTNKALPVAGKLLYHTFYTHYDTSPAVVELSVANELLQARKAVELASKAGVLAAPTPAGEEPLPDEIRTRQTLEQAREYLQRSEELFRSRGNVGEVAQFARTAAQVAENARALALGAVGGIYIRQLEREVQKVRAAAEGLRLSGEQANAQLAGARDRIRELEAALDRERQQNQEARGRAGATEEKLQALQRQLGQLEHSFQQTTAENARLREEREKICGELRRQLTSLGQLTQQGGIMVLTLASDILFDFNSYELRPSARENLAKLTVLRLLLFPQAEVRYEGHTDRVGDDDYNQWLSEQRALAVYRYFLEESLAHPTPSAAVAADEQRLAAGQQLLAMKYAAAQQNAAPRQALLAKLGNAVIGKGEREPVEDVPGRSERNRRVVLLFPPPQVGQLTSLCEAH